MRTQMGQGYMRGQVGVRVQARVGYRYGVGGSGSVPTDEHPIIIVSRVVLLGDPL